MGEEFWVDVPGLKRSAAGWEHKGAAIHSLAGRIRALTSPSLAAQVGLDEPGKAVWQQMQTEAGDLYTGLNNWGQAVTATGEAVRQSAKLFQATDEANRKLAQGLEADIGTAVQPLQGTTGSHQTPQSTTDHDGRGPRTHR